MRGNTISAWDIFPSYFLFPPELRPSEKREEEEKTFVFDFSSGRIDLQTRIKKTKSLQRISWDISPEREISEKFILSFTALGKRPSWNPTKGRNREFRSPPTSLFPSLFSRGRSIWRMSCLDTFFFFRRHFHCFPLKCRYSSNRTFFFCSRD